MPRHERLENTVVLRQRRPRRKPRKMIAQAKGRYIRVAPRKVRRIIDLIRGKDVTASLAILAQAGRSTSKPIDKVLKSAVSNAKQKGLGEEQLFISTIRADEGPAWKRFRAATMGRASPILKRTTHLTIELELITK